VKRYIEILAKLPSHALMAQIILYEDGDHAYDYHYTITKGDGSHPSHYVNHGAVMCYQHGKTVDSKWFRKINGEWVEIADPCKQENEAIAAITNHFCPARPVTEENSDGK
jgi:hypothetical protein